MQKSWLIWIFLPIWVQAQLPTTHLYSFEWTLDSQIITNPQMLSFNNLSGYNNQPHFIDLDEILLVSNARDTAQTDIYLLHLSNQSIQPITQTGDSEYSPTMDEDGNWLCVKVDSQNNQYLWQYPWDGSTKGWKLWNNNKVGYYQRLQADSILTFLTGQPNQLALVNPSVERVYTFTSKIGRTFYEHNGLIYYLHKLTPESWYIKQYDPELRKSTILTKTMPGIEDFHISRTGNLWCAKGAKIFEFDKNHAENWKEWIDLSAYGLTQITRIIDNEKFLICVNKLSPYHTQVLKSRKNKIHHLIHGERAPLTAEKTNGIKHFRIKEKYKIHADFIAEEKEQYFNIPTYSGKEKIFKKYGTLQFSLDGENHELTVYQNQKLSNIPAYKDHLFLPFKDLTNGGSTYGGGRYIDLNKSDLKEGKIWLDFNLCYNPWCAYSDGFNCPVPPAENELPITILAGEKNYVKN